MQNLLDSSPQAKLGYALMAVGALKATEHLAGLARGAWKHLLRPRRWLKARYGRQDMEPWVLISGKLVVSRMLSHNLHLQTTYIVSSCSGENLIQGDPSG